MTVNKHERSCITGSCTPPYALCTKGTLRESKSRIDHDNRFAKGTYTQLAKTAAVVLCVVIGDAILFITEEEKRRKTPHGQKAEKSKLRNPGSGSEQDIRPNQRQTMHC